MAIDVLRGLAASAVVTAHLPFSWRGGQDLGESTDSAFPHWVYGITSYGGYGVHLFLVISGFCIHMQWARRFGREAPPSFAEFWKRRLGRLYPPYLVALLFSLCGLALMVRMSGAPVSSMGSAFGYSDNARFLVDVALLLVLAQNLNGASWRVGNGPFWTLALEEQLYLLYFPLLALRRKWGWGRTVLVVAAVTLAWRSLCLFTVHTPNSWYVVGPARWLEWTFGAIAVEAHLGMVRLPPWLFSPWTALIAFGCGVFFSLFWAPPFSLLLVNDAIYSFAAFVLVNWFCRLDREGRLSQRSSAKILAKLGLMSYSLYLVHAPASLQAHGATLLQGHGARETD